MRDFIWKLGRLRKAITKYHHHVYWKRDVKQIKMTETLLQKVVDDEYFYEDFDKLNRKYGELKFFTSGEEGCSVLRREYETSENKEEICKETRRAIEKARRRRQQDWNYALLLIKKYFWNWWD